MKTLSIITLSFLLSGCFYQTVNQHDLYRAVHFCQGVEKIAEIEVLALGAEFITCRNGQLVRASNIKVEEE